MHSKLKGLFYVMFILASQLIYSQNYQEVSIKDVNFVTDEELLYYGSINTEPRPTLAGDTVIITGAVMNSPYMNVDSNQIETLSAGAPATFLQDTNNPIWGGVLCRDRSLTNEDFAKLLPGMVIKAKVEVVEYFTTTEVDVLEFSSSDIVEQVPKLEPTVLTLDSFYNSTTGKPNFLAEKWEGVFIEIRDVITSEPGVVGSGTFKIASEKNPNIKMIVFNKGNYIRTGFTPFEAGTKLNHIRGFIETRTGGQYGWYMINPVIPSDLGIKSMYLTRPSGGEQFLMNSTEEIKWSIDSLVSNVKIEYSIDNGENWITVIGTTSNDGVFEWTVPNVVSKSCLVKITDVNNSINSDESYGQFTIRESPVAPLIIEQPLDQNIYEGELISVNIETSCFDIVQYQWWQISPDGSGYIKLNDLEGKILGTKTNSLQILNPSILDSSKLYFCEAYNYLNPSELVSQSNTVELRVNKSLFLSKELPDQVLIVNDIYNIQWESKSNIGTMKIEYSTNNGLSWNTIGNVNSSVGNFNWTIPNTPSENCKLRISSTSNPNINDISLGNFIIYLTQLVDANISCEQNWYDNDYDGIAAGMLTGSNSTTNYGTIVSYLWKLNNDTVSNNVNCEINLLTGSHKIFLETTTDQGFKGIDSIIISVFANRFDSNYKTFSNISTLDEKYFLFSSTNKNVFSIDSLTNVDWKFGIDDEQISTPCIYDENSIYVASTSRLYKFDSQGVPIWEKNLGGNITTSPSVSSNNQVCIGMENGRLYILDENGSIKFTIQADGAILTPPSITDEENIYFSTMFGVFNKADFSGRLLNSYITSDSIIISPAIARDKSIIVGSLEKKLYKFTKDLELLWEFICNDSIKSSPVIDDYGNIYFASSDGIVYSITENKNLNWTYSLGSKTESDITLGYDGSVYIGDNDGKLHSIKNGVQQWYLQTDSIITASAVITKSGLLYQPVTNGSIYVVKLDPKYISDTSNFNPQWQTYKGNFKRNSYVWDRITDILIDNNDLPTNYSISQNYPNPFNPTTTITFQIPEKTIVTLKIFDMLGREVTELLSEEKEAGNYNVRFDAINLSSGVYYYRLQAGEFISTKKMILMK